MKPTSLFICLLTIYSVASAAVIPLRGVYAPKNILGRSEARAYERAHARSFAKRQDPIPSDSIPSTVPASQLSSTSSPVTVSPTSLVSDPASSSSPIPTSVAASATAPPSPEPPADPDGSPKLVVAHHMVGNTFPYTLQDWIDDITLAHASGIDGFALNMGSDPWQPNQVANAYQAAQQTNLGFKLFLSLDMSSLPCATPNDAQNLRNLVTAHISHPNQLQYDSRAFVSTFGGESCNFGQGSTADGWKTQFTQSPDLQGKIFFVPSFFVDPTTFSNFVDVMDGDFNWNSGWPTQVTTSFAQSQVSAQNEQAGKSLLGLVDGAPLSALSSTLENNIQNTVASVLSNMQLALTKFIGSTDTDDQYISGLTALSGKVQARDGQSSKKLYMGAVSPWFFTHYGPDSFNKNFVFLADQHLYAKRWESIIDSRAQFDIVEIISWNDYGESHYVGPIKGAQPNSQAWTNGMNHSAWLDLTRYYATAYKTGQFPAIEKDQIFMWSRPHSTSAQAPDPVPQPTNFQILEDAVWAVVMATEPSTVVLSVSPTSSMTFQVPAGVSKLAIPITPGDTMKGVIQRNGQTIVELNPTEFTFQGSPSTYNFNAFVASAIAQ
ncbi:hypothetical protein CVT26_000006 [Gymnopilus dilepis]|uniref:Glycoside hydrolase family 71 protein n=1 Tax=Gymnopilus dilepis TaxID=231916 RepID=A0A409VGL1_9AGAR|nr:hypothetical protein CVT26_000006 [Gymnopilus dilepis]